MIDAIKNGDALAFEQLYELFKEKLLAYFLKKTTIEDAKDLLQITFCKIWQYRTSLSADYLPEQQLFYIARNVFIDYLRKQNNIRRLKSNINNVISTQQPEDFMYEFDVPERLQKVLNQMPSLRKTIFQLHRIEGYSYKEIAVMLSIPVKSVDNNLAKALKYLRSAELVLIICLLQLFK